MDRGKGMSESLRGAAGERFHARAAPSGKGAGLGLAIAYEVAQSHHGALEFADLPQGGFEVSITLPLAEAT
jgi:signal transduction histidine kinase